MQLLAQPPVFAPETLTVDKLLPVFTEQNTPMLFLVSEYGGVEGIVTLRDVVDELLRDAAEEGKSQRAKGKRNESRENLA
jgi:CBS domain containing-hemolysin-like protein